MYIVIDETTSEAIKCIETLFYWTIFNCSSEMPLPKNSSFISVVFQNLCNSYLTERHIDSLFFTMSIILGPAIYPRSLGIPACNHRSPASAAYRMRICLSEADACSAQPINIWSRQIFGPIAAGIKSSLVIGIDDNDIRFFFFLLSKRTQLKQKGKSEG